MDTIVTIRVGEGMCVGLPPSRHWLCGHHTSMACCGTNHHQSAGLWLPHATFQFLADSHHRGEPRQTTPL